MNEFQISVTAASKLKAGIPNLLTLNGKKIVFFSKPTTQHSAYSLASNKMLIKRIINNNLFNKNLTLNINTTNSTQISQANNVVLNNASITNNYKTPKNIPQKENSLSYNSNCAFEYNQKLYADDFSTPSPVIKHDLSLSPEDHNEYPIDSCASNEIVYTTQQHNNNNNIKKIKTTKQQYSPAFENHQNSCINQQLSYQHNSYLPEYENAQLTTFDQPKEHSMHKGSPSTYHKGQKSFKKTLETLKRKGSSIEDDGFYEGNDKRQYKSEEDEYVEDCEDYESYDKEDSDEEYCEQKRSSKTKKKNKKVASSNAGYKNKRGTCVLLSFIVLTYDHKL